jgi:Glycosyltransferase family 87/WD40-like Beta Propeller Repeat
VVFLGYGALRQNFLLGQYYVLLLAVLTVAVYCLLRSFERSAGVALASAFLLKLYGAPFFFFLAAKRRFRVTGAFMVVSLVSVLIAIAMFGWDGVIFYATRILPRSLAGETLNPYHPGIDTFVTLFRRLFIAEPELNPHPLLTSPGASAFLQCAFTLTILLLPVLAASKRPGPATRTDLAWWSIALLLGSPNTALYTFVLLVLPVVLLLDELPRPHWPYILMPYFVLAIPLRPSWNLLFPKAWLLLFLFVKVGLHQLRLIKRNVAALAAGGILTVSCGAAILVTRFPEEPAALARPIATQAGAIYSSSPVVTATGIFHQTIAYDSGAQERYAVRHWDGDQFKTLVAQGHTFRPSAPDSGDKVYVELSSSGRSSIGVFDVRSHQFEAVTTARPDPCEPTISHDGQTLAFVSHGEVYVSDGRSSRKLDTRTPARNPSFVSGDRELVYVAGEVQHSQILRADLTTGENETLVDLGTELASPSISPDGSFLAYASARTGNWQVWIKDLARHRDVEVTNGRCNSLAPAWALDSSEIVFASDCNRGLNLPVLFRMPVIRFSATAAIAMPGTYHVR